MVFQRMAVALDAKDPKSHRTLKMPAIEGTAASEEKLGGMER